MPHEAKAFAAVDRQLRATNRAASASANARHTALVPGLLLSLQRHNSTLEKIGKNLEVRAWGGTLASTLHCRRAAARHTCHLLCSLRTQRVGRARPLQGCFSNLLHAPQRAEHACNGALTSVTGLSSQPEHAAQPCRRRR